MSRNEATVDGESEARRLKVELDRALADINAINAFLSHDLRSPMRFIHAFAQLLAESARGRLTGEDKKNIAFITEGVSQLERLVADLLRYTRLERRAPRRERLDMERLFLRVHGKVAKRRGRTAALAVLVESDVDADPEFAEIALDELFDNAYKFASPDRSLSIEAGTDAEGRTLFVRDNGIGIDPDRSEEIFQLFRRLSTFGDAEGAGVGLALVRRIAEVHGGRAWVRSRPDAGTSIHVTFGADADAGRGVY